jgi:hypothetical protein
MTAPVAWGWNPYGNPVSASPPQADSSQPAGSPQNTAPYQTTSSASTTAYSSEYIPTTTGTRTLSPTALIQFPADLAAEGRSYGQRYGGPKEGEHADPRAEVILLSTGVYDLESRVQSLATQPIDVEGAKRKSAEADEHQTEFFKQVTSNLTPEQATQLKPLYETARSAEGDKKEPAQAEYIKALDGMLTPEHRKTLLTLQRASEDAQLHVHEQLVGQRIRDAQGGNGPGANDPKGATPAELQSLAFADARALVAQKQQMTVDRKLRDLYGQILTPENLEKLAPQQQALFAALQNQKQDPHNTAAQTQFKNAQTAFDDAFYGLIDPNDREVIKGFEAYQRHMQSVAGTLNDEATGERNFYELRTLTAGGGTSQPTALQRQEFKLAQHRFELIKHNRGMRTLALRFAALPNDKDQGKRLDTQMVTALRKNADLLVESRQFDHDVALSKHQESLRSGQTVPFTGAPVDSTQPVSYQAAQGTNGVSPTLQAVNDAKAQLDQAQQQKQQLAKQLKPPKPHKSGWDRALDIAMGVGEILGGVMLAVVTGGSGIGLVGGAAIITDGLFRVGHSVSDAVNGTVTDTPQSRLMQNVGVSRNAANRTDMGISLLATVPVGVGGSALTVVSSSSMLLKGSGLLGGVVLADSAQAGTRSIVTNEAVSPFSVEQLIHAGLTPTQANYVLALGNIVGLGGAAGFAKVRAPGSVKTEFLTYDPANLPEGVTTAAGSPVRVADWHTRGAPKDLRRDIATEALGPGASPRAVNKLANSIQGNPLVVLRTLADDGSKPVVGAAIVRTNTRGWAGRDGQGNRIQPRSAEIKPILGDGEVKQLTVAAGVTGVKQFTNQGTVFWQTKDPEDSSSVPDANLKHQRVRREAPTLLSQLPEDQRPWGTTAALDQGASSQPLSTQAQLKKLSAIPEGDRVNWPVGTRDLLYDMSIDRPLTALGQQWLGKIVHPMHKDSYLGWVNFKFNPVNYLLSKLRPQSNPEPKVVGAFDAPDGGPTRVATFYPAGSAPDNLLTTIAAAETKTNKDFGNLTSFNNHPEERIAVVAKENLKKLDLVVLTSTDPLTGESTLVAGAAITKNYKGLKGSNNAAFPWLADGRYKPGTTYLSHVFTKQPRGGGQVVLAAERVAKDNGARHFAFLTQWQGAQKLYQRQGAHLEGQSARPGADLPMTVYDARFGTNAAEIILKSDRNKLPPSLQQLVDESNGSTQVLQAKLDALDTAGAHGFAAQAPNGALLTRYNMDYSPTATSWRMSASWKFQDAKWWAQQNFWEPYIAKPVHKPLQAVGSGRRWLSEHINPYSLTAFEPGMVRLALRSTGYMTGFGIKQSWTTFRGATIDLAALQAATGNVHIVRDDDRAIRPFNGLPGSQSVAVYFPWTGTLLSAWAAGPNVRGPAPIDDNGLMPLARASASMTDPKGPKGAGVLTAARATSGEVNWGIRWFGNNNGVSAVTAGSLRFAPINVNGRVDAPIQSGGPKGLQLLHSFTWFMPSVSHAFYYGQSGVLVRNLHVTLSGASQTSVFSPAQRGNAYRSGEHSMLGSKSVTTGSGYFLTLNPAYGTPEFEPR